MTPWVATGNPSSGAKRLSQLQSVLKQIVRHDRQPAPVIVGGDFNSRTADVACK